MNTNIQSDIAAARAKLDAVSAELRALEERAKAPVRWEPKGGRFLLWSNGEIGEASSDRPSQQNRHDQAKSGSRYPTREAAESALPYVTFFKRLCCLAQELNPSGKVGGQYYVIQDISGNGSPWEGNQWSGRLRDPLCVFETREAADRAAEIMNRDKWTVPSL